MAGECVESVKRLWTEQERTDHDGAYYRVRGRIKAPRPVQRPSPLLVSAGASPAGIGFAADYCDLLVIAGDTTEKIQTTAGKLQSLLDEKNVGRQVGTSPFAIVIVRDGDGEAEEDHERLTKSVNYEATAELTADILPGVASVKSLFAGMTHEEAGLASGSGGGILKCMGNAEQVAGQRGEMKKKTSGANLLGNFPLWKDGEG